MGVFLVINVKQGIFFFLEPTKQPHLTFRMLSRLNEIEDPRQADVDHTDSKIVLLY